MNFSRTSAFALLMVAVTLCQSDIVAQQQSTNRETVSKLQDQLRSMEKKLRIATDRLTQIEAQKSKEPKFLQIYHLKHNSAMDAMQAIDNLELVKNDGRIAIDERTNALLVQARKAEQEVIGAVLEKLDTRVEDETVEVYKFNADHVDLVQSILRNSIEGTMAYEHSAKGLVVRTSAPNHAKIKAIVLTLSKQLAPHKSESKRVRVVWLVSGIESSQPLPKDLVPIVAELDKLGIQGLAVAAQSIVRTTSNSEFNITAKVEINDDICDLRIEGTLIEKNEMSISVLASKANDLNSRGRTNAANLATINTKIRAPIGHPVVLGVSPLAKRSSAFVVTVYDED